MAHYYIQSLDDNIKLYTTDVQVVHVAGDDVGVSNPNRAQQIVMDDSSQILLQNDGGPQQVVYQTQATPTQYQPPQPGQTYTILGDDINQQTQSQTQIHQQQTQQQTQQQQAPPPQHQQQQILMHQQQQQQQPQQHQVMDHQQHQMQTTYQLQPDPQQQHMQQAQDHQMQHVQAAAQQQQPPPQIYYTTDQLVHQQQQQQQKKVYIQQQAPPQTMQQQYQPHPQQQQQTHQQMMHQQPPPPPQQQPQQHILQSSQHQQVQVQHQVSSGNQQAQQQPQIIYRMQPQQLQTQQQLQQQTQLLGNAQLIVQQPSGQPVLIQQSPQQQELIMRQQPRVVYGNRINFTPQQSPQQQQQQQVIMQQAQPHQQQHIQIQTNAMHHNPTGHMVQQARVVPQQHQQQVQQQHNNPPPPQQQMQQNVVYHQIQVQQNNQMAKQTMQQNAVVHPQQQQQQHIQQLQQQHQQQQVQMVGQINNPNGATIIRTAGVRGGKIARGGVSGTLIARMPGMGAGVARSVFNAAGTMGGGGGQILRTPRPRCSTTAGTTTRGRGGRGARGAAALAAGRGVQLATAAGLNPNAQLHGKLVASGQVRQVFRTQHQLSDGSVQQQLHLVQAQPRAPGAVARFRSPVLGQQVQHQQHNPQQTSPPSSQNSNPSAGSSNSSPATGNFELDLEDSIQAVFVKKDGQKQAIAANAAAGVASAAGANTQNTSATTNVAAAGTTLTSCYAKNPNNDDNGTCMTLAEYKKRNATTSAQAAVQGANTMQSGIKPLQQTSAGGKITLPAAGGQSVHTVPVARVAPQKHIVPKEQCGVAGPNPAASPVQNRPPAGSSVYQTSHNNYEIQTQHVLQNRAGQQMAEKDRNSAKMLVILVSGEQRLITFTLPRESCTVQDLLEQVGVPFDDNTTIQCVENPGANIDFVVTVGFSVQESASELISRAEQSLQISRQQESLQQNAAGQAGHSKGQVEQGSTAAAGTHPAAATAGNPPSGSAAAAANAALSANASTSSSPAPSESSNKDQTTPASKLATTGSSTKPPQDDGSGSSQRKLIQGFYAICQSCGFSGYDHSKCERCKRVFLEPPKKIPIKQANNAAGNFGNLSGSESSFASNTMPGGDKKQRHHGDPNSTQRGKSSGPYNPNGPPTRGRGGSQSGRGRGSRSGRRAAEIEPVILTLSSDEEDDESSNKGTSNMGHFAKSSINSSPASLMSSYKPLSFEPNIPENDETIIYSDFKRGDITDLSNCSDKLSCTLPCKYIRLGTYCFEPPEQVVITSKGVRIVAPLESNPSETFPLHIHKQEVVKVIAHFSKTTDSMLCFYTLRTCAQYIRTSLKMPDITQPIDGVTYFAPNGPYQMRKIIIQFQTISDQAKSVIRSIWDFLDEISDTDAQDLLQRAAESDRKVATNKNNSENTPTTTQLQPNEIRQLLIYPQGKGGISINTEDYMCLATDQYLNDIIIDFYLKWVHENIIPDAQKERTHIFSTFFYKRLTTLTRHINHDKDVKQSAAQKRHARVQNWTKNVNLFEKDFIIIPINEQSHWFLAIICFPKLKGPVTFDTHVPVELQPIKKTKGKKVSLQIGNTTITPLSKRDSSNVLSEICGVGDDDSERDEAEGDDSDLASEDSDFDNSNSTTPSNSQPAVPVVAGATAANTASSAHQPIKQPLILIFDSLAGASRSRVVATLRDYLTCEYKIKMPEAPLHAFNKDNMPGHCVKVPQQNNFTDCGLYLLQYVEQFFKDPIRDYRVPIKQLANWFDTLTVTKKREDISNLIQSLMDERNGPNNKIILPEIPFPTLNGQLVEPDGYNIEFEEEEMEDDEDDDNQTGDMDDVSNEDMSKSKTPIKVGTSTPTTIAATAASSANTTMPTLVPTQGRKIVLKRRMQLPGGPNETSSSSSPSLGSHNTSSCQTPPGPAIAAAGQQQRPPNMTKIRKLEP
ncbi:uncharacterized protein LOC101890437 isoform X1 [Musca domestica]|uniref:Uncharacterized protein LOC101890437 isoform X1 n=1 Tax=Musca domestica TaxID=7370 RepID=A0A9J7D6L0_MUSDO|nr:uncharacterized protein LOC101890437 isoform X1 [Musca domestica]